MIQTVHAIASGFMIEFMFGLLGMALILRYMTYRASRFDQAYYSSFTREVERRLQDDGANQTQVKDVEAYIESILDGVKKQLPNRSLRFTNKRDSAARAKTERVSLREYVGGSQTIIHSVRGELNVFKSHYPPNFREVTLRIMNNDEHWVKLFGLLPIDALSRVLDILPGIFFVFGILGTFVGVSAALPTIANIDFANIDGSSGVLGEFVKEVAFAMRASIVGIICSLALNLLNAAFPLTTIRDAISAKLESSLEHLWFYVQGEVSKKETGAEMKEVISILSKINDALAGRSGKKAA
ncbi:MAG: hypothetical protein JNL01_00365 [Bdellovibrionales bacterium]|nr:hypothetical protein [Bdellovibrionales bacterium]